MSRANSLAIYSAVLVSTLLVLSGFTTGTVCHYCGKDFVHVGKHVWRCRQRLQPIDNPTIHHDTRPPEANSATLPFVQTQSLEDPTHSLVSQDDLELETVNKFNNLDNEEDCYFKECYFGKKCKGLRIESTSKIMQCTRSS